MKISKKDIKTFTYKGNDNMIKFTRDKIPNVHKDFKATLKLKNGKEVKAPPDWRRRIWYWWYQERKDQIETDVLLQASKQMLSANKPKNAT